MKSLLSACLLLLSWCSEGKISFTLVSYIPSKSDRAKRLSPNKKTFFTSGTSCYSSASVVTYEDTKEIPIDFPRREDAIVALAAVRKASVVTQRLQPSDRRSNSITTVSKTDLSPVTVADFAAQAIILNHLRATFGEDDSFIAEESSAPLQSDPNLANSILDATTGCFESTEQLMESIDLGKSYLAWDKPKEDDGYQPRPSRVWCLDPIDGTKGFLRGKEKGGQYAVGLALIEDGIPMVGVVGCPNLPVSSADDNSNYAWAKEETQDNNHATRGCIFIASRGGGCFQLPLFPTSDEDETIIQRLHVAPSDGSAMSTSNGRFCVGVEKGIADALGKCDEMAKLLHGDGALNEETGDIIKSRRMDSMAKYAIVARGEAEYYVRLPRPDYVENVWDHAAGAIVLQEAGGKVTDTNGNPINFGLGAKLSSDVRGILGTNGGIFHDALVQSYNQQEQQT